MSVAVELTSDEIAQIRQLTKLEDESEAVSKAAREFLRLSRLRELKTASGRVEFDRNWEPLEAEELGGTGFPQ